MPSKRSQGMLGMLHAHKRLTTGLSRDVMQVDPPLARVARLRLQGTTARIVPDLPFPALMIRPPKDKERGGCILHLHGGAYVSGGMLQSRVLIAPICALSGVPALTFSYRLAPEHPYPAQLEDAMEAYRYLLKAGHAPRDIVLLGESAGGNLALALTGTLRGRGEEMPAALALLSPWTDLAQRGESYRTLADVDATLNADELMQNAVAFAGSPDRLTDPDISPLYGDFTGFPPVQIHCGTREILLSDSERLEKAMLRDGVDAHLIRWEGMCHVFQAFGFEESRASDAQIAAFVRQRLDGG